MLLKIKGSRSRPCYQNILSLLNRGGCELDIDELKDTINTMVDSGVLHDIGKEGVESFIICEEVNSEDTNSQTPELNDDAIENIEQFINAQFYETLILRVKTEVKLAVETLLSEKNLSIKKKVSNDNIQIGNDSNKDILIDSLNSEIQFLRSELASKNTIIEIMVKDNSIKSNSSYDTIITKTVENTLNKNLEISSKDNIKTNKRSKILPSKGINEKNIEIRNDYGDDESDKDGYTKVKKGSTDNKRNITIIGDSLIKDMKTFKMKQGMSKQDKVYIKSFPGATIECMHDYIKPSLKFQPDTILLHCGTNDLRSDKSAEEISESMIKLAKIMKTNENDIIISSLVARNDGMNDKGSEVNNFLKIKCIEHAFLYCDNSNISGSYLNASGLHLKPNGTVKLANNFLQCLNY